MNITVAGVGYVGLAQAVLLAQHNAVTAVTTTPAKAEQINRGVSPIADAEITDFLRTKPLTLTATVDAERAYRTADVVIIATPTDYDPECNLFNTSTVEAVLSLVGRVNPGALVVIKSTVPVGYTERVVAGSAARGCCSRRSFCARAGHCMITCTRAASWSAARTAARRRRRTRACSRPCCSRARRSRTSSRSTRTRRRPRHQALCQHVPRRARELF